MTRPAAAGLLLIGLAVGCGTAPPPATAPADAPVAPTPGVPFFDDATAAAKIDFVQYDPITPNRYILETNGTGCAWIDFDADGWPDLFCVQLGPVTPAYSKGPAPTHKFYRNNRDGTFSDVTAAVGLAHAGYGQGCAVGDYDNDGFDDLVVTYFGKTQLFHNEPDPAAPGGRRFKDVTAAAGVANTGWGTSCGWADLDGDGKLDLYVCNYCRVNLDDYQTCSNPAAPGKVDICPPTVFPTDPHQLFRNLGNGRFEDVSVSSGVAAGGGHGFAVGLLDLDGDGKPDIYVANDMKPAFVFQNLGGMKFAERGVASGAGLMAGGRFMAGMGVALGDIDGSGRPSVLVSNYQNEPTMVFLNRGRFRFTEWSHPSGIGPATLRTLGFGLDLFDADLDGHLDLAQANGHVIRDAVEFIKTPYEQPAQLFVGDGKANFREVSDQAGGYFREKRVGRGLAVADYDNDGRPDLLYTHVAGPAKLLRNRTETANRWVRLDLVGNGTTSNRNAVGAKVEVAAGGRTLVRWVHGGGSYLSASDRRVLVGLGTADTIDRVTVTWPDGAKQEFPGVAPGKGWRLTQGRAAPDPAGG